MENVTNSANFSTTVHSIKQNHVEGPLGKAISAAAHEKNEVRKTETSSDGANITASENPTELLFKTIVEGVNEVLGDDTIQGSFDAEVDVTPEAVAQKIVTLAIESYPQYVAENSDVPAADVANSFFGRVTEGVSSGADEARGVLAGLNVVDEEVASAIDATYDAIIQGVQSFLDGQNTTEYQLEV